MEKRTAKNKLSLVRKGSEKRRERKGKEERREDEATQKGEETRGERR